MQKALFSRWWSSHGSILRFVSVSFVSRRRGFSCPVSSFFSASGTPFWGQVPRVPGRVPRTRPACPEKREMSGQPIRDIPNQVTVKLRVSKGSTLTTEKTYKMLLFPVNICTAATGHKLHGRSKDILIISSWPKRNRWYYQEYKHSTDYTSSKKSTTTDHTHHQKNSHNS